MLLFVLSTLFHLTLELGIWSVRHSYCIKACCFDQFFAEWIKKANVFIPYLSPVSLTVEKKCNLFYRFIRALTSKPCWLSIRINHCTVTSRKDQTTSVFLHMLAILNDPPLGFHVWRLLMWTLLLQMIRRPGVERAKRKSNSNSSSDFISRI